LRNRGEARGAAPLREGSTEGGGVASRLDSIRESRERGTPQTRASSLESMRSTTDEGAGKGLRPKPGPSSRLDEIMATRGEKDTVRGGPVRPGADSVSRAASISAMREGKLPGVGTAPSGAKASSKSSATAVKTKTSDIELPTEAAPAARRDLPTEGRPNRTALYAAAGVAALVLVGLVAWLASGSREEPQVAQTPPQTQQPGQTGGDAGTPGAATAGSSAQTGSDAGKPGAPDMSQGAAGTQPGQPGAPVQPGQTGAAAGTAASTPKGTGTAPGGVSQYKVKRGDSLWRISDDHYKDPMNWPSVYEENASRIKHPDLIYPKQELNLPAKPAQRFPEHPKGYKRIR
ncbi:MAG: LysM peptidoglycan-binding domain-containing protein, partial [Deltaproteobacteria bacterium]|nr:LysM peptidoglycan-binding domain-containing protein [Deltaproteobacteria bacterium]